MTSAIDSRLDAISLGSIERFDKFREIYQKSLNSPEDNDSNIENALKLVEYYLKKFDAVTGLVSEIKNPHYIIEISPEASKLSTDMYASLQYIHDSYVDFINHPEDEKAKRAYLDSFQKFGVAASKYGLATNQGVLINVFNNPGEYKPHIVGLVPQGTPGAVSSLEYRDLTPESATKIAGDQYEELIALLDADLAYLQKVIEARPAKNKPTPSADTTPNFVPGPTLTYAQTIAQLQAKQNKSASELQLLKLLENNIETVSQRNPEQNLNQLRQYLKNYETQSQNP